MEHKKDICEIGMKALNNVQLQGAYFKYIAIRGQYIKLIRDYLYLCSRIMSQDENKNISSSCSEITECENFNSSYTELEAGIAKSV
jgi:hypothetical protein